MADANKTANIRDLRGLIFHGFRSHALLRERWRNAAPTGGVRDLSSRTGTLVMRGAYNLQKMFTTRRGRVHLRYRGTAAPGW